MRKNRVLFVEAGSELTVTLIKPALEETVLVTGCQLAGNSRSVASTIKLAAPAEGHESTTDWASFFLSETRGEG